MSAVLKAYDKCIKFPYGKVIFSKLVCFNAPYFKTIHPRFVELRPCYGEITMGKRRSVENHLRSVHALAMGNLCELVAGTTLDATLPDDLRWIPKSMTIEYLKIARTDLKAKCEIDASKLSGKNEVPVVVNVFDKNETEVVRAIIQMHITPKKQK